MMATDFFLREYTPACVRLCVCVCFFSVFDENTYVQCAAALVIFLNIPPSPGGNTTETGGPFLRITCSHN